MLLADFPRHNVLRLNPATKEVGIFCHDERFNQPNDLCINTKDQVFASDPNWSQSSGQLWRIDPGGEAVLLETGMGTTNGIELGPDERRLYVNESVQRRVWRYDVDARGNVSNKKLLIEFVDNGLDGMKCDREGNLYITRWGKGTVAVVSPEGRLLREVVLKGKKCSNLVFGGKDGLSLVRCLLLEAPDYLKPGAPLLLEIASGQEKALAEESFPGLQWVGYHKDYAGLARFVEFRRI